MIGWFLIWPMLAKYILKSDSDSKTALGKLPSVKSGPEGANRIICDYFVMVFKVVCWVIFLPITICYGKDSIY